MDRAVRIAGALTNAIRIMLKEPSINAGRHTKALEQLTQIFETATEKLEKRHENKTQTLSTPTTREKIRTTPEYTQDSPETTHQERSNRGQQHPD